MKRIIIATAMSLCVVSLAAVASADTLIMRDGTRIQGTVVGIAAQTITFRHTDGISRRYATSGVESLQFVTADRANGRGNGYGKHNGNGNNSNRNNSTSSDNTGTLEAPAGTEIVVRTVEMIDSRNAGVNQTFSAIVEENVTNASGRVIVPQRSSAQLIIRQLSSGGTTGSPEMVLDIQSITVDGRRYVVSTTDLSRDSDTGIGANKRTAEAVGGGAALGTIIGAIAGGGKGAAIGGAIGAAGGAGAQILTKGHDVRVPAETVLRFRLDKSVTMQANR
jgi:hypothetical protein